MEINRFKKVKTIFIFIMFVQPTRIRLVSTWFPNIIVVYTFKNTPIIFPT